MAKATIKGGVDFDASSVGRGVNQANSHIGRMGKAMGALRGSMLKLGVGGFAVGAGVRSAFKASGNMAELTDTAAALEITTDQLQAFKALMIEAGGSASLMETLLLKLNNEINELGKAEFGEELNTPLGAFADAIGMSIANMQKLGTIEVFEKLSEAIQGADDKARQLAESVVGVRGRRVLPMMDLLAQKGGMDSAVEDLRARGAIQSEEQLNAADKAMDEFGIAMMSMANLFKTTLIPAFLKLLDVVTGLSDIIREIHMNFFGGKRVVETTISDPTPISEEGKATLSNAIRDMRAKNELETLYGAPGVETLQKATKIESPAKLQEYLGGMNSAMQKEMMQLIEISKRIERNTGGTEKAVKTIETGKM